LEQKEELLKNSGDFSSSNDTTEIDTANQRIRELELELAQTKLALVETECKNQVTKIRRSWVQVPMYELQKE